MFIYIYILSSPDVTRRCLHLSVAEAGKTWACPKLAAA